MNNEDYSSRWYRGLMGGKSRLQLDLERELAEKRAQNPKIERPPLKWYWWIAIVAGLVLWTVIAFTTYDFSS